jgi:hypothetical protein
MIVGVFGEVVRKEQEAPQPPAFEKENDRWISGRLTNSDIQQPNDLIILFRSTIDEDEPFAKF